MEFCTNNPAKLINNYRPYWAKRFDTSPMSPK